MKRFSPAFLSIPLLIALATQGVLANNKPLSQVLREDEKGLESSRLANDQIGKIDDARQGIENQHRQLLREIQLADKYTELLLKQIEVMEANLLEIEDKQTALRKTRMTLMPLMEEMLNAIEDLLNNDMPFLLSERQLRLQNLKHQLNDASLTVETKMATLLDAYQVELSYGYTSDSWQDKLDGQLVTFIRIGRIGWYYYSLDHSVAAKWQDGHWQPLPSEAIATLIQTAGVASGERLPQVIMLPNLTKEIL